MVDCLHAQPPPGQYLTSIAIGESFEQNSQTLNHRLHLASALLALIWLARASFSFHITFGFKFLHALDCQWLSTTNGIAT